MELKKIGKLLNSKKGALNEGMLNKSVLAIVFALVLFSLYATLVPEAQTQGDTLCSSGVPLGNLFNSTGVVFILIMIGLLVLMIRAFIPGGKK